MKKIRLFAVSILLLASCFVCCEKPEDPEPPITPLVLDRQIAHIMSEYFSNKIHIDSGNGGYYIVYPEPMNVIPKNGRPTYIDYDESYFSISINGNFIVVEPGPALESVSAMMVTAVVEDQKGQRSNFTVMLGEWLGQN